MVRALYAAAGLVAILVFLALAVVFFFGRDPAEQGAFAQAALAFTAIPYIFARALHEARRLDVEEKALKADLPILKAAAGAAA